MSTNLGALLPFTKMWEKQKFLYWCSFFVYL